MSSIGRTRDLFLFCMSVVYLAAFSSLYIQIPGLYGNNGILPAKQMLNKEANSVAELMEERPTLLMLTPKLGLDVQQGMDLLCFLGIVVSFLCVIARPLRDCVSFILLWMLYFSLYQVGQTFLWFQWDILLLEAGFLLILVAPFNLQLPLKWLQISQYHQHDSITLWLVRWLLFRFMFMSGVVKLTSHCPTWWGLTALNWHFESQCIPTPPAWYFHHMPAWFLQLSVVMTYLIEIAMPFLFFTPVRGLRLVAFWSQVLLQALIIVTGNYNFFNLLTITLCIVLLDDQSLGYSTLRNAGSSLTTTILSLSVCGYLCYETIKQFSLSLTDDYTIESKTAFSQKQFDKFLSVIVPLTIYYGAISLGFEILVALVRCFTEIRGIVWKNWAAIQCLLYGALAVAVFSVSLIPYSTLHKDAQAIVPAQARALHKRVSDFHVTNSYGLFRRMTGVGGRPEVVIEGSNSKDGGWKEYEFYYKPGDVKRRPPIVAPHQPRLDWQMWFAALGSYQHNPWFVNLAYRLLTNQPEVLELIQHNPFPNTPPRYIRAQLYTYHYTPWDGDRRSGSPWWTRELTGEYLPALAKDDAALVNYLEHNGIIDKKSKKKKSKSSSPSWMAQCVDWLRSIIGQPEGFVFVMSVILSALTIYYVTGTVA